MARPNGLARSLGLAVIVATLTLATIGQPVAAQATAEPAFVVEVNEDGSAEISVRSTFDLTDDGEQQAFETLMNDEEAQSNAKARFLDRMRLVASDAETATGRKMRVTDPTIELTRTTDNETGTIILGVSWSGLAVPDGDSLVITEPFASGFAPERTFHLRAPDGYQVAEATPEPDEHQGTTVSWDPGTKLDGFSVTLQPAPATDGSNGEATRSGGQPGFGIVTAILAVLVLAGTVAVRRTHRPNRHEEES